MPLRFNRLKLSCIRAIPSYVGTDLPKTGDIKRYNKFPITEIRVVVASTL